MHRNHLGQSIGAPLLEWTPPPFPARSSFQGRYCRLEPLAADRHAEGLFAAYAHDEAGRMWTYMPVGPFDDLPSFQAHVEAASSSADPQHYAILTPEHGPVGTASYLRINARSGSIETGWITMSPLLQQTRASTEAMYLMMKRAFDLGYRRYEWKCDALNAPSRAAAERLGFIYEGTFRQATHYKGRNRDTSWFSIIDSEWPARKAAFEAWLSPQNFDAEGRQCSPLAR